MSLTLEQRNLIRGGVNPYTKQKLTLKQSRSDLAHKKVWSVQDRPIQKCWCCGDTVDGVYPSTNFKACESCLKKIVNNSGKVQVIKKSMTLKNVIRQLDKTASDYCCNLCGKYPLQDYVYEVRTMACVKCLGKLTRKIMATINEFREQANNRPERPI